MYNKESISLCEDVTKPLISIIMNGYNCEKYMIESIDSILKQSYLNWELIFWDNASTDSTASIISDYDDIRIRYFCGEENVPLGQARNLALSQAHGEFLAFLDSDDKWLPNKLDIQINYFRDNPLCGFVYTNFYKIINGTRQNFKTLKGDQPVGQAFLKFLLKYPVNLQTVMIRVSVIKGLDRMFDPKLELVEEFEFFMRIHYVTHTGYIDTPLAEYRVHDDMTSLKKISLWPVEFRMVMDEFKTKIPDYDLKSKNILVHIEAKASYYEARARVANGEVKAARELLRPYISLGGKYRLIYYLLILSPSLWKIVHKMFGRIA
jgi:glycosyltransferase involved in cell wall biosynthesis